MNRNPSHQHDGTLNIIEMGNYSVSNGLKLNNEYRLQSTIKRRKNMQKIKLRIMTVINQKIHEPFEHYLLKNHNPHLDSAHRYNFALLNIIKDMFNFT